MQISLVNKSLIEQSENEYIVSLARDMAKNSYRPGFHYKKRILTIIACHANSAIKFKTIMKNMRYLNFVNNDIIIVSSAGESHSGQLREALQNKVKLFVEISNNSHLDIGKWCHVLTIFDYKPYDFVVFTNDSFVIMSPINHFFNKMIKTNVDLYGYNDSTQIKYHYQSYLFGLKTSAVPLLQNLYQSKIPLLTNYMAVVENIELTLTSVFRSKDCFLKIGNIGSHKGKNIFFNSDPLYLKLIQTRLLPIVKLKRVP